MNRVYLLLLAMILGMISFASLVSANNAAPDDLPKGLVFDHRTLEWQGDSDTTFITYQEFMEVEILNYYLNGKVYQTSRLIRKDNRIFIPLRLASEAFEAKVDWDNAKKQAVITDSSNTIMINLNSRNISVNGKTNQMDVEPIILGDKVFLPFRAIGEALNKHVGYYQWTPYTYYIIMTEKDGQDIENEQQFSKIFALLAEPTEPDLVLLDVGRNWIICRDTLNNDYRLNGAFFAEMEGHGTWLSDVPYCKDGLEDTTIKYWYRCFGPYEAKDLLIAFYPDGMARIVCDTMKYMVFLKVEDGYLYFTSNSDNPNDSDSILKRINLNTPQGQPFIIEIVGVNE